mmetsp:Transcript_16688/g.47726  ORF Transcript_16688/g.47726 Transcript_16688/m.47726 type:complete len:218 (-) Transcript_16688:952-1605(-)
MTRISRTIRTTRNKNRMYMRSFCGWDKMLLALQSFEQVSATSSALHNASQSKGCSPTKPYPRKAHAAATARAKFCAADATPMKAASLRVPSMLLWMSSSTTQHWAPTRQKLNGLWQTRFNVAHTKNERRLTSRALLFCGCGPAPFIIMGTARRMIVKTMSSARRWITHLWIRKEFRRERIARPTNKAVPMSPTTLQMPASTAQADRSIPCNCKMYVR